MPEDQTQKIGDPESNVGDLTAIPNCSNTFFYTLEVWENGWSAILDPQPTFVTFDQSTFSFTIVAGNSDIGYADNTYVVNFIIETYNFNSTDLSQRF